MNMRSKLMLLAGALVGLVALSGAAAAYGGLGVPMTDQPAAAAGNGPGDGTGPMADERPLDGSNSPWLTGDERLEIFQDRFDLTDEQVSEIRSAVLALEDPSREDIRDTVTEKLESFGVEDPEMGPPAGRGPGSGAGQGYGPGAGNGAGHGGGYGGGYGAAAGA